MASHGTDVVLLSVGSDLPYFTGYEAMPTERLTVLVVPADGEPVLVVPELEAPRVVPGDFETRVWSETDDPVLLAAQAAGKVESAAVGDHMWSAFLVAFQDLWPHVRWSAASNLTKALRIRKEPAEIEALRQAAHGVDRVMGRIPGEVRFSGRTELELSRRIAAMTMEEGHGTVDFAMVGSGPNGASPHHEPGDRVIGEGDLVVCDFGGRMSGYHSDSTRTFSVGPPAPDQVEVHRLVLDANRAGVAAVAPGVRSQDVDRAARKVITDAGYGEHFIHRTGHGIGLEVHEHPYMVEGNETVLAEGMTFSVEPGIYLPGRFGVRIEDIVACGSDGADVLNRSDRALVVVE